MAKQEQVNLKKSLAIANIFYFIYNSGKACLFPFLTLYFRQLGLSATQTGIIFGTKAIVALLATPVWSRCATKFNKYRIAIIISMFVSIASHLGLMLIPPAQDKDVFMFCTNSSATAKGQVQGIAVTTPVEGITERTTATLPNFINDFKTSTSSAKSNNEKPWNMQVTPSTAPSSDNFGISQGGVNSDPSHTLRSLSGDENGLIGGFSGTGEIETTFSPITEQDITTKHQQIKNTMKNSENKVENFVQNNLETNTLILNYRDIETRSAESNKNGFKKSLTEHYQENPYQLDTYDTKPVYGKPYQNEYDPKKPSSFVQKATTTDKFDRWLQEHDQDLFSVLSDKKLYPQLSNIRKRSEDKNELREDVTLITDEILASTFKVFIVVLMISILGDIVSSPFERLLDDTFFGFLDDVDDVEKYGQQKFWSLCGYVIWGVTISIIIESTPCLLNFNISHFMIHFYGFAALMGLAFLVVLFFPVQPTPSKDHSHNKLLKCIKLVFSDSHTIAYAISMFLTGIISASKFVFLFWLVTDLHGTELAIGLSVSVCALSQIPMLYLCTWFSKKLTQTGLMCISLASVSLQCIYYSFLWTPWAVVPIEIMSMFSIASLLVLSMTYAEHTAPPGLDRTMQHVFWTLYWQVGFSIGCFSSGFVYDSFSPQTLFRGVALLALLWAIIFLIITKYAPRSKRRLSYSKLLQKASDMDDDDDGDDDDSDNGPTDVYSDDWLVNALKKDID
ncbi:major facilitator superfamily domain-containing protein 6-like protein A [Glandiceps talaboti]